MILRYATISREDGRVKRSHAGPNGPGADGFADEYLVLQIYIKYQILLMYDNIIL